MAITVTQDWDNDGYLSYTGAETLTKYQELNKQISNAPWDEFGVFAAFSQQQFDEGCRKLVESGKLKDGEKVVRISGVVFGVKGSAKKLDEYYDAISKRIKNECNPQEVYFYEYNNFECCIAYDGDKDAIRKVIDIFGIEVARKVKRFNAYKTLDEVAKDA